MARVLTSLSHDNDSMQEYGHPADNGHSASSGCDGKEGQALRVLVQHDWLHVCLVHLWESTFTDYTRGKCSQTCNSRRHNSSKEANKDEYPGYKLRTLHFRFQISSRSHGFWEKCIVLIICRAWARWRHLLITACPSICASCSIWLWRCGCSTNEVNFKLFVHIISVPATFHLFKFCHRRHRVDIR